LGEKRRRRRHTFSLFKIGGWVGVGAVNVMKYLNILLNIVMLLVMDGGSVLKQGKF
jgi:hypothetical protein